MTLDVYSIHPLEEMTLLRSSRLEDRRVVVVAVGAVRRFSLDIRFRQVVLRRVDFYESVF